MAVSVKEVLPTFLWLEAARPFAWGRHDCALVLADWWQFVYGTDPAAALRGTYATKEQCDDVVRLAGGLVALVEAIARRAGALRIAAPLCGAIGVVGLKGKLFAGIWTGSNWAMKAPDGLSFAGSLQPETVWRV